MEVSLVSPSLKFINFPVPAAATVNDLVHLYCSSQRISAEDFYVKKDGRLSHADQELQAGALYRLEPRLCGGKGGFGSMLRALGAQIEKTTNREACRDLSGRRLRDVNHEKEMAEWLKNQTDREADKEQRRLEKLQRKLAEPKHSFTDGDYEKQCHNLSERLEDSVLKGMQASSGSLVQPGEEPSRKRAAAKDRSEPFRKKRFWAGLGDLKDMDSSDSDSNDEGPASSSSCSASMPGPSCRSDPAAVPSEPSGERSTHRTVSSSSSSSASSSPPHCLEERGEEKKEENMVENVVENVEERGEEKKEENMVENVVENVEERVEEKKEENVVENVEEKKEENMVEKGEENVVEKEEEKGEEPVEELQQSSSDGQEAEKLISTEMEGKSETRPVVPEDGGAELDLLSVTSVEQLELLGLEKLKVELLSRGLKCGGTLQERAARLFSIRGLKPDQIDSALLAKPGKNKKKSNR